MSFLGSVKYRFSSNIEFEFKFLNEIPFQIPFKRELLFWSPKVENKALIFEEPKGISLNQLKIKKYNSSERT